MTESKLTMTTVVLFLITSAVISLLFTMQHERKIIRMIQDEGAFKNRSENHCEVLLHQLFQLIERCNSSDSMIMIGQLLSHIEGCNQQNCECLGIIAKFEKLHKFTHYKSALLNNLDHHHNDHRGDDDTTMVNVTSHAAASDSFSGLIEAERSGATSVKTYTVSESKARTIIEEIKMFEEILGEAIEN